MTDGIIVFITAGSEPEAERIGRCLVDEHLAACVNLAPVRSLFIWEGKPEDAREILLICKSRRSSMGKLVQRVKELHSYSVPEIIALPIIDGSAEYLSWVEANTAG